MATIKRAFLDASASGNTAIVAAVTGKRIRVRSYQIIANGAVVVQFRSANTQISPSYYANAAGWQITVPYDQPVGYFQTAVSEALNINLSAAVGVSVQVMYEEI
jgi:hypothetical protein